MTPSDKLGLGYDPRDVFNKLEKKLPFVLGKGAAIWIGAWLSLLVIALRPSRRLRAATPFIPFAVLLLTMLIASPSGWDYRYVFPFALMLPYMAFFIYDAFQQRCP